MKSVLITGGAGFIGSNIAQYLIEKEKEIKIRILDNLSTGNLDNIQDWVNQDKIEFMYGDISNLEICRKAMQNIDVVCHQAALGSVPRSVEDPLNSHISNVNGFLNILIAAKEAKIRRIVYASSSSVYGDNNTLPKTENLIGNVLSPYAATKRIDEIYANVFSKCYQMECIGLRYFNVFGPRQNPNGPYAAVIPKFMYLMMDGKSPTINGDGTNSRDFTYVDNVIQANILAMTTMNTNCYGEVFNIGTGGNISLLDLFSNLKTELNFKGNPIFGQVRQGDITHSHADITKAQQELNYDIKVSFKEGINKLIAYNKKTQSNKSGVIVPNLKDFNFSILLSSTQHPGYGGAATNSYKLFKYIQKFYPKTKCAIVFFTSAIFPELSEKGVFKIPLDARNNIINDGTPKKIEEFLEKTPDIILAKNYAAPVYCRQIWENKYIVYMVSGLPLDGSKLKVDTDLSSILNMQVTKKAFDNSNLILYNSSIVKNIDGVAYPMYAKKVYPQILDTSSNILNNVRFTPYEDNILKEFDIIINCSMLTRIEKNNDFLIAILSMERFNKYSKIIIGENYEKYVNIPNSKCLGLISHDDSVAYLRRSKLLLYPSLIDANPNTIREAVQQKCLILTTNRVGFHERFPDEYIIKSFDANVWTDQIVNILENYTSKFKSFDFGLFHDEIFPDDFQKFLDFLALEMNNSNACVSPVRIKYLG